MTLHPDLVRARLEEIARVVAELGKYRGTSGATLGRDLSLRWIVERGIMAAAGLVFDIADHVLAASFSEFPDSYEASLVALRDRGVISAELHARMRGLGHLRNVLAHGYVEVDMELIARHLDEGVPLFTDFAREVDAWLAARP